MPNKIETKKSFIQTKKGFTIAAIIIVLVGIITTAVTYSVINKNNSNKTSSDSSKVAGVKSSISNEVVGNNTKDGLKTYSNEFLGITMQYPSDWNIKESKFSSQQFCDNLYVSNLKNADDCKNPNFIPTVTFISPDNKVVELSIDYHSGAGICAAENMEACESGKINATVLGKAYEFGTQGGQINVDAGNAAKVKTFAVALFSTTTSDNGWVTGYMFPDEALTKTVKTMLESIKNIDGTVNTTPIEGGKTGSTPNPTQVSDPYAGWKTIKNSKYNVTFRYPTTWTATDYSVECLTCTNLISFTKTEMVGNNTQPQTLELRVYIVKPGDAQKDQYQDGSRSMFVSNNKSTNLGTAKIDNISIQKFGYSDQGKAVSDKINRIAYNNFNEIKSNNISYYIGLAAYYPQGQMVSPEGSKDFDLTIPTEITTQTQQEVDLILGS